jgi:uncharacterized protein YndB with AHSA1/START domain
MKLNVRHDIEASADEVFRKLTDFGQWERDAMRRGAEVQRTDRLEAPGPGMSWAVDFTWRGAPRHVTITLVRYEPGVALGLEMDASVLGGEAAIDLVALSPRRTRLQMKSEITSRSILGRILLQSLRLAKARITERLQDRLAAFAATCETKARPAARRS